MYLFNICQPDHAFQGMRAREVSGASSTPHPMLVNPSDDICHSNALPPMLVNPSGSEHGRSVLVAKRPPRRLRRSELVAPEVSPVQAENAQYPMLFTLLKRRLCTTPFSMLVKRER